MSKILYHKAKRISFDDYADERNEYGTWWVYMCAHHVNIYGLKDEADDSASGDGICGVKGCNRGAGYYVDFLESEVTEMEDKRKHLDETHGNGFSSGLDDDAIDFYYDGDISGICLFDLDRWAWLNTLFGYNIGWKNAREIINDYYLRDKESLELGAKDKAEIKGVCNRLKLNLTFGRWAAEEPKTIRFSF